MIPPPRPPAPADERLDLDPAAVDALAATLHGFYCRPAFARPALPPLESRHWENDQTKARVLLAGLRDDRGWHLTHTTQADRPRCLDCGHSIVAHLGDGCWYAVVPGAALTCPCERPPGWQPALQGVTPDPEGPTLDATT